MAGTWEAVGHRTDVNLAFTESTVWVWLLPHPSQAAPELWYWGPRALESQAA